RDIAAANDAHSKFSGHVYVPQYRFCSAFTAAGAVGNSHLHRASKPWTSRAWRSLATAWLDLLKPARVLDRLAREALVIVRLVVLHNEKPGLRPVAHGVHDLFPLRRACALIGPAVLVGSLALGRYVLDVNGRDAVAIFLQPRDRVRAAAHDPCDVG